MHYSARAILFVSLILMIGSARLAAQQKPQERALSRPELEFVQRKAQANMKEIESRMQVLLEQIREAEPDHASRLLLVLQRSRENLIVDDMRDAEALINTDKFDEATERQRIVLKKLEELRQLLLSTNLDLFVKLNKLRQLKKLQAELAQASKDGEQNQKALEEIAAKGDAKTDADKKRLETQKELNQEQQRKLDELNASARDTTGQSSEAKKALDEAQRALDDAQKALKQSNANEAAKSASRSQQSLNKAGDAMQQAREELAEELADPIRAALLDALAQMIEKHEKVNDAIMHHSPAKNAAAPPVVALEREVVDLAKNARELVEETDFAVALPHALALGESEAANNVKDLAAAKVDDITTHDSARLLDDLNEMHKTILDEAAGAKKSGSPRTGGCKGCANRNKTISELKMVRLLQSAVYQETAYWDKRREKPPMTQESVAAVLKDVANWQKRARLTAALLKDRTCAECLTSKEE
ncbi:MAG: hypothetical protein HY286_17740 [Planctomycetes bacterium]|nr:hypothetical protein [Planctomycetota bacterium]